MRNLLQNKQVLYLFFTSFATLFVGMGLFPILPLYAAQFGASNSVIGLYFAIIYISSALGPVLANALSGKISRKALLVAAGIAGIPALVLMGLVTNLWQLILLTSLIWFTGGLNLMLVSIFIGMHTSVSSRGKAYSLTAMAAPLGSLVGGATVGPLVTWQGYTPMFFTLALVWTAIPLIGLFLLQEKAQAAAQPAPARNQNVVLAADSQEQKPGRDFYLLLVVTLLAAMAINVSRLGISISMQELAYTASAISSANMISGLIAIPVTLVIGTLSDRLGRKRFLTVSYLFTLSGSLILVSAASLWQFWLASILQMLAFTVTSAMAQAFSTEVLPAQEHSRGLFWVSTTSSTASIMSFAAGGMMIDALGLQTIYLTAAILAIVALATMETFVRSGSRSRKLTGRITPPLCEVNCA